MQPLISPRRQFARGARPHAQYRFLKKRLPFIGGLCPLLALRGSTEPCAECLPQGISWRPAKGADERGITKLAQRTVWLGRVPHICLYQEAIQRSFIIKSFAVFPGTVPTAKSFPPRKYSALSCFCPSNTVHHESPPVVVS